MNDYKELIAELKELAEEEKEFASNSGDIYRAEKLSLAADAIEQLVNDYEILAKMYAKANEDLCVRTKERDAAIADLEKCMHYAKPKNNNVCNFCKKDMSEYPDKCDGWSDFCECEPKWRGVQETSE